jgi:hypothetical protein
VRVFDNVYVSPIDAVALAGAKRLASLQPRMDNTIDQLPPGTPGLQDVVPVWHQASNDTLGITLQQLGELIGEGGGTPTILFTTDFSAITMYNYGNFVGQTGLSAAANTAALNAMFAAMSVGTGNPPAMGGGLAWIPQFEFAVNGTPSGNQVPDQTIMQGLGGGGTSSSGVPAYHFIIGDTGGAASTFLTTGGPHSTGGVEFRNLSFQWPGANYPGGGGAAGDQVFYVGVLGTIFKSCTFTNCPTAISFAGLSTTGNGLTSIAEKCHVDYLNGPNNATAFILAGEQCQIVGPSELRQTGFSSGGPSGCTCIAIGGGSMGAEHQVVSGCHISDWNIGIDFGDTNNVGIGSGCEHTSILANEIQCWAMCINMKTFSDTGKIFGAKIIGNTMLKSQNSTDGSPLILLDTDTGDVQDISSVDFIGNLIASNVQGNGSTGGTAQNNQYGIQIGTADSIRIIGGRISNFGNNANLGSDGSANICISGSPQGVIVEGVDLRPGYANAGGGSTGAGTSQYALLIKATASLTGAPVQIHNCDMTNFVGNPVSVNGSATINAGCLYITNCPGYNDQQTVVNASAPTSNEHAAGQGYYGPSIITFTNGGSSNTLTINGQAFTLPANAFGSYYLASPWDVIAFGSSAGMTFTWIGY